MVCHCRAVSERTIRRAIVKHGATTVDEVGAACGAGRTCGGCHPAIAELLAEHLGTEPAGCAA